MGIFSNIFGRRKDTSNYNVDDNPWAGLSSYEDPEEAKREGRKPKLFCGRDEESHNVAQLITGNIFVTLYGKSGTGKTSLLNAGVFPLLRQKRYLPVSIRLSMDALDISFQQCILHKLAQTVIDHQGRLETINVVDMPEDEKQPDYLWSYFARTRFVNRDGQTVFPVIVFDQFEEVFRNRRKEAETLLRQIAYLMDESHALTPRQVDGRPYQYDFNFRFVTSIREDDLYRLEDSIDNLYLPALKRCRYRLRSLKEQEAMEVILIPGEGLFLPEEGNDIANSIIDKSRNEDDSISTNIISLLCSRIYIDYLRSGATHISQSLVDTFIKGNPFERFYNEATHGFSNREKSYIEDNLVDSTGRRNSIPESNFLLHVKNGADLLEGSRKILQRTSTSSNGENYRIELIHDSFCEPLAGLKEKRERRRRIRWIAMAASIILLCGGITAYIANMALRNQMLEGTNTELTDSLRQALSQVEQQRDNAQKANLEKDSTLSLLSRSYAQLDSSINLLSERNLQLDKAYQGFQTNLSRVLAESSIKISNDQNPYLARLIALQALPPNRPYTHEAEVALRLACQNNDAVLRGHTSFVFSASFSPDGKRIVSASSDHTVRVWDAQSCHCLRTLKEHTSSVYSASFSPDSKRIVSASADKTVRIWDAQTGQCLHTLKGHTYHVISASFSPDGKRIVSASVDNTVRIWDAQTGQCLRTLKEHTNTVNSASFSPDGKRIISASGDKTVRVWDVQTGQCLHMLEGHTNTVNSASFSPDGKRIVSASGDKTVRVWDVQTGQCLHMLEGHTDAVNSASFSYDGKRIISASSDETILIWDAQSGQCLRMLEGHTSYVKSASFSPDSKRVVSASSDHTVRVWDAQPSQYPRTLYGHTSSVKFASFSPDGKRIVSASLDETARIWDAQTGQCLHTLEGHTDPVESVSFSPDSKRIVSASWDKTLRVWDAQSGQCLLTLLGHTSDVKSTSFSPDGKRIVSASNDRTVRIWDAQDGQCLCTLRGHTSFVNSASFSPDGKRIVSASSDNSIRIWDVHTGQCLRMLEGHTDYVHSTSFSPDGKRIVSASSDYTIRIWDAQSGQCLRTLEGHASYACSASFSSDGKRIISASGDKTVRVWDAQTGQCLHTMEGHTDLVESASFSFDGKRIVSASWDKTIKIWEFLPIEKLIEKTSRQFKDRPLTPEERRKYYLE